MVRWFSFAVLATAATAILTARDATRRGIKGEVDVGPGAGGDTFSPNCQAFPGKRVVLVTVNGEYVDMFENWLHHASHFLRGSEQVVTVAQDADAGIALRKLSTTLTPQFVVIDEFDKPELNLYRLQRAPATPRDIEEFDVEDDHPFMTREFGALVRQRPSHIKHFLDQGCSVLYNDIDTVWRTNPFMAVNDEGPQDVYATDDDSGGGGLHVWNLCSCFIYVNPKPVTLELMDRWSSIMNEPGFPMNDQPAFNQALREHVDGKKVDFALLPYNKFPPGAHGADYRGVSVFHANWRVGHKDKVNFIKDRDMWVVPCVGDC